jgi:hypothetical protein
MSKKGSYIGGHTLLTQKPGDFDAELERKAVRTREKAIKAQASFDKRRARKLGKNRAKLKAMNEAIEQAAADRRAMTQRQIPDKIRRAPKTDFVVLKISRKSPRWGSATGGCLMQLIRLERITKLGCLGEELVSERLHDGGFTEVENLNLRRNNYPFGDLVATKDGVRYFIGVKARNEMRQGNVGLNESYNLVLISDPVNARLKQQGKTTDQITSMLLAEVSELATGLDATPAWATVSIRPKMGTYSAYFGLVVQLGNRRSVPMTPKACATYRCLARDRADSRVTPDLLNV